MPSTKEVYYFSHDANARHDPNILKMRRLYGSEGYGWYWMIVEMMREQTDYRIEYTGSEDDCIPLAMQMLCTEQQVHCFINDCISKFLLFNTDGQHLWSDSLLKRMELKDDLKEKRREAALSRWKDANAMQTDANAMQNDAKESKVKETKVNEIKESKPKEPPKTAYAENVKMTEAEYNKLVDAYGEDGTKRLIEILDNAKGAKGYKYKSDYRAILNWVVKRYQEERGKEVKADEPIDYFAGLPHRNIVVKGGS